MSHVPCGPQVLSTVYWIVLLQSPFEIKASAANILAKLNGTSVSTGHMLRICSHMHICWQ